MLISITKHKKNVDMCPASRAASNAEAGTTFFTATVAPLSREAAGRIERNAAANRTQQQQQQQQQNPAAPAATKSAAMSLSERLEAMASGTGSPVRVVEGDAGFTPSRPARGAAASSGATAAAGPHSPKVRPLSWLLSLMDDVYEQRLKLFAVEVESSAAEFEPFARFVHAHLGERYGLGPLVARNAADLVRTVAAHAETRPEVAQFRDFLAAGPTGYDPVDLLFYLFARARLTEESAEEPDPEVPAYLVEVGVPVPRERYKRRLIPGTVLVYVTRKITAWLPEELAVECIERLNDAIEAGTSEASADEVGMYFYLGIMLEVWNRCNREVRARLIEQF
jgi:hypothetical protein